MTSPAQAAPFTERRKPPQLNQPKDYGWTAYMIIITLLMIAGFFVSHDDLYKAGDRIGYNLGLVGGIMMLTLLIYPLRKRFGFMKNLGLLPSWFRWHMVFGILGPALIMFHSTFMIRSFNAGVALICMLLVSGSGIFGRFFYTKIHHGLYGRLASQKQLQDMLDGSAEVKSVLSFAPGIQQQLNEFRDRSMRNSKTGKLNLWNSLQVGMRSGGLFRRLEKELHRAMYAGTQGKNWNKAQKKRLDEVYHQNRGFLHSYVTTVRDLAQFSTYERLFSLWHIFHIPLVYMLVFTSVWHVIAVHQY